MVRLDNTLVLGIQSSWVQAPMTLGKISRARVGKIPSLDRDCVPVTRGTKWFMLGI